MSVVKFCITIPPPSFETTADPNRHFKWWLGVELPFKLEVVTWPRELITSRHLKWWLAQPLFQAVVGVSPAGDWGCFEPKDGNRRGACRYTLHAPAPTTKIPHPHLRPQPAIANLAPCPRACPRARKPRLRRM
jgi:hypothetical protein